MRRGGDRGQDLGPKADATPLPRAEDKGNQLTDAIVSLGNSTKLHGIAAVSKSTGAELQLPPTAPPPYPQPPTTITSIQNFSFRIPGWLIGTTFPAMCAIAGRGRVGGASSTYKLMLSAER